jgi:hypothetical protein
MCTVYEIITSDSRPEDEGNKFLINCVTIETTVIFTGTAVRTRIVHSEKYLNEKGRANLQVIQRTKNLVIFWIADTESYSFTPSKSEVPNILL